MVVCLALVQEGEVEGPAESPEAKSIILILQDRLALAVHLTLCHWGKQMGMIRALEALLRDLFCSPLVCNVFVPVFGKL